MVKIFKNKTCSLLFGFFFSLVSIVYVYGSPQGYTLKESEKSRITKEAENVFRSKCEDRNTNMKDLYKAYKAYKKAFKISTKAYITCEESFFNSFKEDYYEDISKEQQKDVEDAYGAYIKAIKAGNRAAEAMNYALYKLAKANRSYYKIKKVTADYRIEKAKKHFDEINKILDDSLADIKNTSKIYIAKAKTIGEGDNIFTRVRKQEEGSK